jgi:NADH-quinone oxidoreductase subunit C
MDKKQLEEFIKSLDQESEVKEGKQFAEVIVPLSKLHHLCQELKEKEETQFDFLVCISGVDYGQDLGVIYHLRSTRYGHNVVVKARITDRDHPAVDSVYDLWKTADFLEREVYDLLGVKFINHPDMRRLFLDSSWGFPLRKDYVDDVNIVTK